MFKFEMSKISYSKCGFLGLWLGLEKVFIKYGTYLNGDFAVYG
jgi:hypothetical protein